MYPGGPEVAHAFLPDEVPALEVAGHPEEVPVLPELYGVDVQAAVVNARFWSHHHTAAVEASVADGDLKEAFVLGRFVVTVREGQAGREGLVLEEGPDGGHGVRQWSGALFQPRGERPRCLHRETHGGDVNVIVVTGEAEVNVDDLAAGYSLARPFDVERYFERPREVVGGA